MSIRKRTQLFTKLVALAFVLLSALPPSLVEAARPCRCHSDAATCCGQRDQCCQHKDESLLTDGGREDHLTCVCSPFCKCKTSEPPVGAPCLINEEQILVEFDWFARVLLDSGLPVNKPKKGQIPEIAVSELTSLTTSDRCVLYSRFLI